MFEYEFLKFAIEHSDKLGPNVRDAIVTLVALYLARQGKTVSKSVQMLTEKMAVVVERVDSHEVRLEKLEDTTQPG